MSYSAMLYSHSRGYPYTRIAISSGFHCSVEVENGFWEIDHILYHKLCKYIFTLFSPMFPSNLKPGSLGNLTVLTRRCRFDSLSSNQYTKSCQPFPHHHPPNTQQCHGNGINSNKARKYRKMGGERKHKIFTDIDSSYPILLNKSCETLML